MKPQQPSQSEVHRLFHLANTGHMAEAEQAALSMLKNYPNAFIIYNILGVAQENQRKFEEALATYRKAISIDPSIAEVHVNMGAVLGHLGRTDEAIACYRKAIQLRPDLVIAYFNLGIILQQQMRYDEAVAAYRKAIALEPGFYEAIGNLGTVLQRQGKLEEATSLYRKALAIHEDARGHFNLGTALRDEGKHEEASRSYLKALEFNPGYADAHNNLGEIFRDQGNMEDAILCYQNAIEINPDHPNANYNMGEFHSLAKRFAEAIPYFERSHFEDFQERAMECLYKIERYDEFREKLNAMVHSGRKSMMLATLSTHHATNFGVPDEYNFCPDPMRFAWHTNIPELAEPDSPLLQEVLETIDRTPIAARKQGRLYPACSPLATCSSARNPLSRSWPCW
jgi:tetratricopeptide (TPR) repeat protein